VSWVIWGSNPCRDKRFTVLQKVKNGSMAHLACKFVGTWVVLLELSGLGEDVIIMMVNQ
jgi:hypothetical protein